jgi:hypothetical protein
MIEKRRLEGMDGKKREDRREEKIGRLGGLSESGPYSM